MTQLRRFSPCGLALAVVLLAAAPGCDDSGPTEPVGAAQPLPESLLLLGSAESLESDGTAVTCRLDLLFELTGTPRQIPGGLEYDGTHGGGIQRSMFPTEGNGYVTFTDVFGAVVVRSLAPDRIEILIPVNAGTGSRFWEELSRFEGRLDDSGEATGTWNCAPTDVNEGGYVDVLYTAPGSWSLTPEG